MVNQSRFMLAFFAIALLAISFASADLILTNTSATTATVEQGNSISFNLKINNTDALETITGLILVNSGDFIPISFTKTDAVNNTTKDTSFTVNTNLSTTPGVYTLAIKVSNGTNSSNSLSYQVNVTKSILAEICGAKYAPQNITFGEIEDDEDGNDNEWEWMPSDKISITINNIENRVDDDEKFDISLLFYKGNTKVSGSKIASDDDDLKIDDLKIDGDDEEDATFKFTVASDADEENYDMYVKVEGKYGCYVEKLNDQISIDTEDGDYSIVSNVNGPTSSGCGETVDLAVTVSNIGDDDADRVKVILYNKDLGVNMFKEIEDLDRGDEAVAYFSFVVPQNAVERNYKFSLYTEFDYDDDDDSYDEESDSEYDYSYTLSLSGNCVDPTKPTLTAKLNSSAIVGENLVVAVTFKNNGNTSVSAILAPEEYESWAELVSIEPATISVGRAESKTVLMTFKPAKAGQQTFNINAIYSGKSIDQPVTVSIEANPGVINYLKEQLGKTGAYLLIGIIVLVALIVLILIIKLIVTLLRKH
jgi:hypothetical protein